MFVPPCAHGTAAPTTQVESGIQQKLTCPPVNAELVEMAATFLNISRESMVRITLGILRRK